MADLPLDQIILGDNCEVLRTFPSESVDLVVTSPPYDSMRKYGGHSWDFHGVAEQLARVIKPGGVIVWNVADETLDGGESGTSFRQALHFMDVCGLRLHDTMIWNKKGFRFPEANRYHQIFEYMFVFSKGSPATFNGIVDRPNSTAGQALGASYRRDEDGKIAIDKADQDRGERRDIGLRMNIWEIQTGGSSAASEAVAFNHPAIFPEALPRDHIRTWSNEGEIVLDPFSGSGTTAEMARQLGRRFIGIEVNPEYVEISRKRMAQQLLFGAEG